jgi:hypothetical protein
MDFIDFLQTSVAELPRRYHSHGVCIGTVPFIHRAQVASATPFWENSATE